ncbi:hypothetical protein [Helicovermis profundi]|uniref:Uncharacterized protein n=1 Tax=Helicovermis profundi TaxID=3065157 RepID=A0AAU9EUB0_9FIRM|nr:hypothetical protein HLPR_09860 [Clostridia bacterium S502]
MYYVTIFAILSDAQFGTTRYQDIDKKFIKKYDLFEEAYEALNSIKNTNLKHNFPYAVIEKIDTRKNGKLVEEQKLFKLNFTSNKYESETRETLLSIATKTSLNPFEDAQFIIR